MPMVSLGRFGEVREAMQSVSSSVFRIVDANANRASEGLRVVEEFLRFARQDRQLSRICKQLRHDLADVIRRLPTERLHACRSIPTDVGRTLQTGQEYQRHQPLDVAQAGLRRTAEALRCLEEYSKLLSAEVAKDFESLRYQLYALEKALTTNLHSGHRLRDKRLYVLVDGAASEDDFERRAGQLVQAGVDVLQLRDKRLEDSSLIQRARCLRRLTSGTDVLCVINDRPDIAKLVAADGVHVGQEEMAPADVRAIVGPDVLIGVSTHSIEQVRQAVLDGADYLGVGPVFRSHTKSFEQFPGLDFVAQVAAEVTLPIFAIGGIDTSNVQLVMEAGVSRVAIGAAVWSADDPIRETESIRRQLATPVPG